MSEQEQNQPDINWATAKIEELKSENEALRKMLSELEVEKATMAHNFLTSSLRLRVAIRDPIGYVNTTAKAVQQ